MLFIIIGISVRGGCLSFGVNTTPTNNLQNSKDVRADSSLGFDYVDTLPSKLSKGTSGVAPKTVLAHTLI